MVLLEDRTAQANKFTPHPQVSLCTWPELLVIVYNYNAYCLLVFVAPAMNIAILPELALQVTWTPAFDASHSPLTYTINVSLITDRENPISKSVQYPISMQIITGLPMYSAGSVSLQVRNPGAMSEAITANFRMVNITGEGMVHSS